MFGREARVWAVMLVTLLGGRTASSRRTFVCEHCYCWVGGRDGAHPVACGTLRADIDCCFADSS